MHPIDAKCLETNRDPLPLTDSEKDFKFRGRTQSEYGTLKLRQHINNTSVRSCNEQYLDSLYLQASQPTRVRNYSTYAQFIPTNQCKVTDNFDTLNGAKVQFKF